MQANAGDRRPCFWLIVGTGEEGGEPGPLSVDLPSRGKALAVFSFREEAQMHLRLEVPGGRWHVEEAAPEELVRMLSGPLCGIGWVALDPIAEGADARLAVGLVSMSRKVFLGLLSTAQTRVGRPDASSYASAGSGLASSRRR